MNKKYYLYKPAVKCGFLSIINVKKLTMKNYNTTQKVRRLIDLSTKEEVAKSIGISRPTLDARLSFHNWKISEIALIKML